MYMAREGMIPRESFFNPENMQKLMGARRSEVERVKGIEPSSLGWEPRALPLSYTRSGQ